MSHPDRRPVRAVLLNVVVAAAYFATGWLGLQVPYYGQHVTLVWAPTAVALAAVVLAGPMVIPGIVLGCFGLNVSLEPDLPGPAALIAIGNTLAPALTGTVLVRWYGFRPQLDRLGDAFAYLAVGVLGTGLITATLGALWLCAFGDAPWGDYAIVWMIWFGGEAAGSLIVGPLLLTWLSAPDPIASSPAPPIEKTAMALSVAAVSAIALAFGERLVSLPYAFAFLFPWILLRGGTRGVFLAAATVALVLVVGTAVGIGPFIVQSPGSGMLSLWLFLAVAGGASLTGGGLIGERDRALHHQRRLLAELDHRVKNTLATIVALAERSGDHSVDLADFRARIIGRVRAIARTHESLARSNWEAMRVGDVVAMTLAPFASVGSDHLLASGDTATLAASKVGPLTVVLHELATNAAKYGAWSQKGGRVAVAWARTGNATLRLSWRESGGPPPSAGRVPGYGLRLIEGTVGHELAGDAELDFRGEGLVCTLHIPTG
ncbi:MAG TPA: MASE1 domain-containing protein [Candidatus Dormibacteraeota bacterium]|nr:MASE1 domain-containing protein [Candidatus Dormibacteraeota bacterium]